MRLTAPAVFRATAVQAVVTNRHQASEKDLVTRARGGDEGAFTELFELYRPLLHSLAYRLVGGNDCEDVVMDTCLKAYHALPRFRGKASFKTWLCRILHNCALDSLRSRRRQERRQAGEDRPAERDLAPALERIADPGASPDQVALARDLGRQLAAALAQLPEEHRTALLMREADGDSYREIASATGVALGTVMSRIFHAKRKMRRLLGGSLS